MKNINKVIATIAFYVCISSGCYAAKVDLELVSFDGPGGGTWAEVPWSTVSKFYFVDLEVQNNTLVGGTFNVVDFWVQNTETGSGFIDNSEYYLSLSLRDHNVFNATFSEQDETYTIVVSSGLGSGPSMTYEVAVATVPLPAPLVPFSIAMILLLGQSKAVRWLKA